MKKIKAKGGYCTVNGKEPCKNNDSVKKKDWCHSCRTYTEKYMFYDFEATQNTGTHTVNLSIAQDFEGKEYIHNSIEEFCKGFLNDKFKGYTFIAHNSKGYDCQFVLKWLIDGGRTNATKLLYKLKENECGRYVDFCSLYPTVQYYQKYPVGHPTKIFNPEKYDKSWYGLIKCKVVPPRKLYHPVLPQRIKVDSYEKLVFTLCKTCAETRNQNKCKHTDTQRSFIGTWTTDEVSKALEKGYKILRIYEVWHFAKSTDTLFKGYIRRFMKIKLESSSYNFKTKEEEASFKARIKDSLDIDVEKFEFNAGLRSIAKLCLNSLWGKFGQRNNMSQTKYVTDVSEFYEILLDDKLGNKNVQFINDDMVQMTYNFKDQFVDNSNNTNIYIACFTTSHARLMLYDKLDYLNEKVLYFDTDSIIYADDNTKNIETGDMLGDMTDEISGKGISSFVSTGPKSYSFKYGDDEQKSAIKGFTLNHENNNLLNHDSLSKIVKGQVREITIVNESKITRNNREIVNKYCEKIFKFGYDKRVIKHVDENHINTIPYGY